MYRYSRLTEVLRLRVHLCNSGLCSMVTLLAANTWHSGKYICSRIQKTTSLSWGQSVLINRKVHLKASQHGAPGPKPLALL